MKKLILSAIFIILFICFGCDKFKANEVVDATINQEQNQVVDVPIVQEQNEVTNLPNTMDMVDAGIAAEKYLSQEVPELIKYEQHIKIKSDRKAFLIVESDGELHDIVHKGVEKQYFMVYVGEKWDDHQVNWYWFYVSENYDEVLWYEIIDAEIYTLSEWRNSSKYKKQYNTLLE